TNGVVWVASVSRGLFRWTNSATGGEIRRIDSSQGFTDGRAFSLAQDADGSLLSGGQSAIFRYDEASGRAERQPGSYHAHHLIVETNGVSWSGSPVGLTRRSGNSLVVFNRDDGLPAGEPNGLHRDVSGALWVAT